LEKKTKLKDEWTQIREEIQRLKAMVEENKKKAKALHSQNGHLRETIKLLQIKYRDAIFASIHIVEEH